MSRSAAYLFCWGILVCELVTTEPARADGGFFWSETTDLAQTHQQALLAVHGDKVTYVIRSLYVGGPNEFAWVLPLPNTPNDVIAHPNDALFRQLAARTRPVFASYSGAGVPCVMAATGGGPLGQVTEVEASGHAGVYDWAALTSTGASSLLDWLNANGYNVSAAAGYILEGYILQDMHFLAVRVREDAAKALTADKEIPPIQFTVQTTKRFYPMVISRVSATSNTEVLLYVLAAHRARASNLPNIQIDPNSVIADPNGASGTNYESLVTQAIDELGGLALVTEYASPGVAFLRDSAWPQAPADVWDRATYLTRMRTVLSPNRMTQDFEFSDAATDATLLPHYDLGTSKKADAKAILLAPLAGLLVLERLCSVVRRSRRQHDHKVKDSVA